MKKEWLSIISLSIIATFLFVSIFATILASAYPYLIWNNTSTLELPSSPLIHSLFSGSGNNEINYKKLFLNGKINAIFPPVAYNPYEKNLDDILIPPGGGKFGHYMGTDEVGRDIASRMIHGTRNSMMVGLVAVGISLFLGIIIGAIAGYAGGVTDLILSRIIEIVITFPVLILIMAVLAIMKPSLINIMIVIGLTGWTSVARVIRGEFLQRKNMDYVLAVRIMGASHWRIIVHHILPNSLAPVLVMTSFEIAGAVLIESSLSFLGIGVQPPEPSWGQILNTSKGYIDFAWWLTFFPGLAVFLVVVSYNLLGDNLRKKFLVRT